MRRLRLVIYLFLFFPISIKINFQTNNNLTNLKYSSDQKQITKNYNSTIPTSVNFTSSNLPIIVITTAGQKIPDEPKITADMGIIYNGAGVRNNLTDPFNKNIITIPRIYAFIDSLTTYLDEAQKRNFERWPILGVIVWPNPFIGGSYRAEIHYLKQWLQDRILWMDAKLPGNPIAVADHQSTPVLESYKLNQNYPNPFNSLTYIEYVLLHNCQVILKIFNFQGQKVRTLVDEFQMAGAKLTSWVGQITTARELAQEFISII